MHFDALKRSIIKLIVLKMIVLEISKQNWLVYLCNEITMYDTTKL